MYEYRIPCINGKPVVNIPLELRESAKDIVYGSDEIKIISDELVDPMLYDPNVRVIDLSSGKMLESYVGDYIHPGMFEVIVSKDDTYVYATRPSNNYKGYILLDKGLSFDDDCKVIQNGLDKIHDIGKGAMLFTNGTYDISDGIRIHDNTFIIGYKNVELIVTKAHTYGDTHTTGTPPFQAYLRNYDTVNGNSNISIYNVQFNSNVNTGDARLSQFVNVSNLYINRCEFNNGYVSNLEIKGINKNNYNIVIDNCKFNRNLHSGVDNVHADNVIGLTIRDCEITHSPDIALDLAHLLENIKLINLNIHDNASSGIFIESPNQTGYVNNFNILGTTIDNCASGMVFSHPGGCKYVKITNTYVSNCKNIGIHLRGVTDKFTFNQVSSVYNGMCGVEIDSGVNNVTFNQCIFNGNGHNSYKFGVYLHGGTNIKFNQCIFIDDQETPTQQWGIYADNLPGGSCEVIACHFEGNILGAIQPVNAFYRILECTGEKIPATFGGGIASIPIGGDNEYGNAVNVADGIKYFDAVISLTAGAGEIITAKFECVFDTGTTYVEKTLDNSSGTATTSNTYVIDVNDKLNLLQNANWLKAINCYAKSSLATPSSSAYAKINIRWVR